MSSAVLVVGGAGYIGSHACKALSRAGYLPVAYDDLSLGHAHAVKWGPLEVGDIADRARLDEALARHRPVAAMHFAAFAAVGESVADPEKYYRNNVAGTLTLLAALRAAAVDRFVFSSTCAVYGTPGTMPIAETTPKAPVNPYGRSKLMVEQALEDYGRAYGFSWTALRYFNAAGADPDGEIGEEHEPETHLIPRALFAAKGTLAHLDVFGDDYPTQDGTCIRDYIHVTDLADAHVAAIKRLEAGGTPGAFNLGTGQGYSVRQVIDAVECATKMKVPIRMAPRRAGDPPELVANPALARTELGFAPKLSDIDTIVATAWRRMAAVNRQVG
ncbi:MAG: UDP-glucose 4-epimerase GalE [Alphaproteobacteria bacterium]|nr:UDP-glucose 4-epimerase GalE [Alphaproteobacteria bacterium]